VHITHNAAHCGYYRNLILECVCNREIVTGTFKKFQCVSISTLILYRLNKCFGAAGFIIGSGTASSVRSDFLVKINQVDITYICHHCQFKNYFYF
jgi:hypothetical protein